MTTIRTIAVESIRTDGGTQMRVRDDRARAQEYAEWVDRLPPVVTFFDGRHHWLADGFARLEAHRIAEKKQILAEVRQGTQRDAVLYAAGANTVHGLKRGPDDTRRAIETLLRDPEWGQWSDRQIAAQCGLRYHDRVGAIRKELSGVPCQIRTTKRGGSVYEIDVTGLAQRALAALPPERQAEVRERAKVRLDTLATLTVRVTRAVVERIDALGEDRAEVVTRLVMGAV